MSADYNREVHCEQAGKNANIKYILVLHILSCVTWDKTIFNQLIQVWKWIHFLNEGQS